MRTGFLAIAGLLALAAVGTAAGDECESPNQAVELGSLGRVETKAVDGTIDYRGDDDWFKFNLTESARIAIYPQWLQEEKLRFVLYDVELTLLAEGGDWLGLSLEPGDYLTKVDSPQGTGHYRLYVSTAVEVEPNEDPQGGLFLGGLALGSTLEACGAIDPGDDVDYFTFEIAVDACPDATLRIFSPRPWTEFVDMTLYRLSPTGRPLQMVARSSLSGSRRWSVVRAPGAPGRYGIRVEGDESQQLAFYNLTIRCFVPCRDREPNDRLEEAVGLGTLDPAGKIEACGYIEIRDQDVFQFSLSGSAEVVIATGGDDDGDSYLTLTDSHGRPLATDDNAGGGGWSRISLPLGAGDYYVIVSADPVGGSEFEYQLAIEATPRLPCVPEREPNDEFDAPMRLGVPPVCVRPVELGDEDVDMFQFQVTSPSTIAVQVSGEGYFSLYIADASQPWIIFAESEGEGTQALEADLEPGSYLLHVGGFTLGEYMVVIEVR